MKNIFSTQCCSFGISENVLRVKSRDRKSGPHLMNNNCLQKLEGKLIEISRSEDIRFAMITSGSTVCRIDTRYPSNGISIKNTWHCQNLVLHRKRWCRFEYYDALFILFCFFDIQRANDKWNLRKNWKSWFNVFVYLKFQQIWRFYVVMII